MCITVVNAVRILEFWKSRILIYIRVNVHTGISIKHFFSRIFGRAIILVFGKPPWQSARARTVYNNNIIDHFVCLFQSCTYIVFSLLSIPPTILWIFNIIIVLIRDYIITLLDINIKIINIIAAISNGYYNIVSLLCFRRQFFLDFFFSLLLFFLFTAIFFIFPILTTVTRRFVLPIKISIERCTLIIIMCTSPTCTVVFYKTNKQVV